MMYEPSNDTITADEFIKREYRIWGEEYIDDLINGGYTPVLLSNGKWSWLYSTADVVSLTN